MGRQQPVCAYCGEQHPSGYPHWNAAKNAWSVYVDAGGKRLKRVMAKGWEGHDTAMRNYAAGRIPGAVRKSEPSGAAGWEMTLAELVDLYLDEIECRKMTAKSIKASTEVLGDLVRKLGDKKLGDFQRGGAAMIKKWGESHKGWGPGTLARNYATVKACFNWAASSVTNENAVDLIPYSPIKKLNTGKTRATSVARATILTAKQVAILEENIADRGTAFRRAFQMLLGTGMRPDEFCRLTAADVHEDQHGNLFCKVDHKNQHTLRWAGAKRPVRFIGDGLQALVREAIAKHPDGPLFRNAWGVAWTKGSLLSCIRRLTAMPACKKAGLDAFEMVQGHREYKVVTYTLRHTFAHRCLTGYLKKEGRPLHMSYAQVADLMGNTAGEVERTYGKISLAAADLVEGIT